MSVGVSQSARLAKAYQARNGVFASGCLVQKDRKVERAIIRTPALCYQIGNKALIGAGLRQTGMTELRYALGTWKTKKYHFRHREAIGRGDPCWRSKVMDCRTALSMNPPSLRTQ